MTAILKYESRRHVRSSILLGGLLFVFSLVFLAILPGIKEETEALEDALPEYMIGLLGFEELHTIEGYTSGY